MSEHDKTFGELTQELQELQKKYDFIKAAYDKEIVDAKRKEDTLKESESRYRALIDLAVDGILLGTHEGIISDANQSMCSMIGIAKADLVGKHISQVPFTSESLSKSPFRFDLLQKGEIVINDRVIVRPDSIEVTVEMRTKMMPDGTYQSIYRDITERKLNEANLRKSEQMLQTVLDNFPGVVFWKDKQSNYLGCNHLFALGAGLNNSAEIVGKNDFDFPWSKTEAEKYRTDDKQVIESGKSKLHEVEMQHQNYGKVVWFDTSKIALRDPKGQVIGVIGVSNDITDRMIAEKALHDSEESYRTVVSNTPLVTFKINKDGVFTLSEGKGLAKIGLKPGQVVGLSAYDLYHDYPSIVENIKLALTGKVQRHEIEVQGVVFDVVYSPIVDNEGNVLEIIGVSNDITERKMAEQASQESEERLRAITESVPDIITELDRKGTILYMSRVLPGFTLDEVIGKNFCDWVAPEYHSIMMESLDKVFKESVQQTYQIPGMGTKGEMRWYRSRLSPIYIGGKVKNVVLITTDITEQKKVETEILKEKHFNEKLLDSLPVIFYLYDKDLRLCKWNKKHVDELGYNPDELDGFPVENWHQLDEAKTLVKSSIQHVLENNTFISIEATLYHKNGEGIPYLLTGVRFDSAEGPMLMGVGVNITNLKNVEKELIKAKEKAEESDRLKTAFLQNMSHEIRTPMNAIMGFSELIVEYYNDKPKLEKFAEIINQRSNDLLDIINDILDIAKIESVQIPINVEACNLNELFGELTAFFAEYQVRSSKQHIEFSLQTHCNPFESNIATDKVKLKQIFINLISNAFKFTDSGSIVGGCKFDGKHNLIFYVSDTGIGIPLDKQDIVFERFTQLNPGEKKLVSGTGLGLSIVKGLVTLLGGEIFVESEVGKGTTFSFTIPYQTIQPIDYKPLVIEKTVELQFSGITILIVEDDKPNAEYLKEILSIAGFNLIRTEYGNEAVKIAISGKVDLVLMDVRLPDMDGYEATRQIRQSKPNLKIIAQTAYASHQERQKALDSGCNDYISKPINKNLLMTMISHLLQK